MKNHYSKEQLDMAKTALFSTMQKCEKIQHSGKLQSSQKTLNDRRVFALRLALDLIEQEMEQHIMEAVENNGGSGHECKGDNDEEQS